MSSDEEVIVSRKRSWSESNETTEEYEYSNPLVFLHRTREPSTDSVVSDASSTSSKEDPNVTPDPCLVPLPNQKKCSYCSAVSTPMWRHGPAEYKHLCNSCGVKWRRGKILMEGNVFLWTVKIFICPVF
jgi:hypothetical protein